MATIVSREHIGITLEREYGGLDQQDQHIDYFYIRVGHQIAHKMTGELNVPASGGVWRPVWPGLLGLFGENFPKQSEQETERQREDRLNKHIKTDLIGLLKSKAGDLGYDPSDVHVMFYRFCKYTNRSMPVERPITTDQIGIILNRECGTHNVEDLHISLFYIMIRREVGKVLEIGKMLEILPVLKTLPGDWRKVEPKDTWPDTFFGHFPKETTLETEREREERLNREVRIPLKGILEQQVATNEPNAPSEISVTVVLARACKYT